MATINQFLHRSSGDEKLLVALLVVGADYTADGSNYWTFTIRHVKASGVDGEQQAYGEQVGDVYTLATRSLVANEPVTIYDEVGGVLLRDGDELRATMESTGSPVLPTRPAFQMQFQRMSR